MVVDPYTALPATGIGFGFAVNETPMEGQGALTAVRQVLPSNVFAPGVARFRISAPLDGGSSTEIWTGGFPVIRFRRIVFP